MAVPVAVHHKGAASITAHSDEISVAALRHHVHDAGLPFPPLPAQWLIGMRRLAPWIYSTRALEVEPVDVLFYVREVEESEVGAYVVLAHTGHGATGYYLHLFAVHGPLALFVQLPVGGPRRSGPPQAMRIAHVFAELDVLFGAVAERPDLGALSASRRLVVLVSDPHGSAWRWADDGEGPLSARSRPHHEIETVRGAILAVQERERYAGSS